MRLAQERSMAHMVINITQYFFTKLPPSTIPNINAKLTEITRINVSTENAEFKK